MRGWTRIRGRYPIRLAVRTDLSYPILSGWRNLAPSSPFPLRFSGSCPRVTSVSSPTGAAHVNRGDVLHRDIFDGVQVDVLITARIFSGDARRRRVRSSFDARNAVFQTVDAITRALIGSSTGSYRVASAESVIIIIGVRGGVQGCIIIDIVVVVGVGWRGVVIFVVTVDDITITVIVPLLFVVEHSVTIRHHRRLLRIQCGVIAGDGGFPAARVHIAGVPRVGDGPPLAVVVLDGRPIGGVIGEFGYVGDADAFRYGAVVSVIITGSFRQSDGRRWWTGMRARRGMPATRTTTVATIGRCEILRFPPWIRLENLIKR